MWLSYGLNFGRSEGKGKGNSKYYIKQGENEMKNFMSTKEEVRATYSLSLSLQYMYAGQKVYVYEGVIDGQVLP